jgi:hypothetical protein
MLFYLFASNNSVFAIVMEGWRILFLEKEDTSPRVTKWANNNKLGWLELDCVGLPL